MQSHRIEIAGQTAWQHDSHAHGGTFHTYDQLALHGDPYGWHKVHVWLPPGYSGGTSGHSVVFANDGQQVFFGGGIGQNWWIQEVVQQSAAGGITMALPIVVGVDWRERPNEYLHVPITRLPFGPVELRQGGGLGPYSNYLADQIVPFIDANYRTIRDRQHRVALGSSHGGLAAFFTGVSHGDVFGQVIAMSSSFWAGTMKPLRQSRLYQWTEGNLRKVETRPRIYIDWGLERFGGYHNEYIEAWATSRGEDMLDILVRDHGYVCGVDLMAVADPDGEHNEDSWRRRLPGALRFTLGRQGDPLADRGMKKVVHEITLEFGSTPPNHYIRGVVKGTMLEPLTTPEETEFRYGAYVWAYPDVPDEVWNFARPILVRRVKALEDRSKIMAGYVS